MSKQYTGVTRTLELGTTSYRGTIFKPSKPVLDSELSFSGDLQRELNDLQVMQALSSGFYPSHKAITVGYDDTGTHFGINLTTTPNHLIVKNLNGAPFQVNVLGDTL